MTHHPLLTVYLPSAVILLLMAAWLITLHLGHRTVRVQRMHIGHLERALDEMTPTAATHRWASLTRRADSAIAVAICSCSGLTEFVIHGGRVDLLPCPYADDLA